MIFLNRNRFLIKTIMIMMTKLFGRFYCTFNVTGTDVSSEISFCIPYLIDKNLDRFKVDIIIPGMLGMLVAFLPDKMCTEISRGISLS